MRGKRIAVLESRLGRQLVESLPQDSAPLEALVGALERGEIDGAVFTNAEQARNLLLVAERLGRAAGVRAGLDTAFK